MKVDLAMVMSVDGKITKWGSPKLHSWTSKEDQRHFAGLIESHTAIVMGRKTFNAARTMINLPNSKLRMVITRTPEAHRDASVAGMIEFTDQSPRQILDGLNDRGHESVLLAGGGEINALFFADKCVDELLLTIEPKIFGIGNDLVAPPDLDVQLRLIGIEHMNEHGTVLARYRVER